MAQIVGAYAVIDPRAVTVRDVNVWAFDFSLNKGLTGHALQHSARSACNACSAKAFGPCTQRRSSLRQTSIAQIVPQ